MTRSSSVKRRRSGNDQSATKSTETPAKKPSQHTPFIEKTYRMLETSETDSLIAWLEDGSGFVVTDCDALAEKVLPRFFNHGNFASFVRQLHFYGFHKTSLPDGACEFRHEHFKRGRRDLLPMISRKSTDTITKQRSQIDDLQRQITILRQQNERLMGEKSRLESQLMHSNTAALAITALPARNAGAQVNSQPTMHLPTQQQQQQQRHQQQPQQQPCQMTSNQTRPHLSSSPRHQQPQNQQQPPHTHRSLPRPIHQHQRPPRVTAPFHSDVGPFDDVPTPMIRIETPPSVNPSAFTPNFDWSSAMFGQASPRRPSATQIPVHVQIPPQQHYNGVMAHQMALSPPMFSTGNVAGTTGFSPLPDVSRPSIPPMDWGRAAVHQQQMQQQQKQGSGARA